MDQLVTSHPLLLLVFLGVAVFGFYAAFLHARKEHIFKWHEYFLLAGVPLIALLPVIYAYGAGVLYFFLACMVLGLFAEHTLGYVFHKVLTRHLWRYYRYTYGGYTSLLVAPFWGMAGVFFFLLSRFFIS